MLKRIRACLRDVTRMRKLAADLSSFGGYASDRFLVMLLGRLPITGENEERTIRFTGGVSITYRLRRLRSKNVRRVNGLLSQTLEMWHRDIIVSTRTSTPDGIAERASH